MVYLGTSASVLPHGVLQYATCSAAFRKESEQSLNPAILYQHLGLSSKPI